MTPKRVRTVEGSCLTCKQRRIKCDLARPCSKCVAKDITCHYEKPLRFQMVEPLSLVKKTKRRESKPAVMTFAPIIVSEYKYFETVLSPKLTVFGDSLKIENHLKDPFLNHFIEVVSNAHQAVAYHDETTLAAAKYSRTTAIFQLRNKIIESSLNLNFKVLFTGNVFLCLLDGVIHPNDKKSAVLHLKGGRAILQQVGDFEAQLQRLKDPISLMMLSYFCTIDLTYCIITNDKPHFDATVWSNFASQSAWWGNLQTEDPFLRLLEAFTTIASGVHLDFLKATELQKIQSFLVQTSAKKEDRWDIFCAAFSLSGLIYLLRAVCGFSATNCLVQRAVADCVYQIGRLQDDQLHHCLLFPILISGTHARIDEQQETIRRSIISSYSHLQFGNVRKLWDFLEESWLDQEFHERSWVQCFETISDVAFFF